MRHLTTVAVVVVGMLVLVPLAVSGQEGAMKGSPKAPAWLPDATAHVQAQLLAQYGEGQRARIERGLKQVGQFWRAEDGDAAAFEAFAATNFAGTPEALNTMFDRYEYLVERTWGHMQEIGRELRQQTDLDAGPIQPYDEVFAGYDPSAHLVADWFENKLAFVVLLNFPLTTLDERVAQGDAWTRRQWAETRLAEWFGKRTPADVNLAIARAGADAAQYIAQYNVWMYHVLDAKGQRLFPKGMRLLSHWNLRDEIKADYGDANGLAKQKVIAQVMERIVTQTIPAVVIDNPQVDWNPFTNEVKPAAEKDSDFVPRNAPPVGNAPEPDTRYARLLEVYRAVKLADPYSPTAPSLIARRFDEDRQIPEARVRAIFEQVLGSPLLPRVAALVQKRLGRPLQPFDIWYNGFRPPLAHAQAELDAIVAKKYPSADAYRRDIPAMLVKLGFAPDRAQWVADNIVVDPARGSGHAMGAAMHDGKAHLRTRVGPNGMDYKGYNIAVHEMGHNVEQTFSLNAIDHYTLYGVPNTAFTEALAMTFQNHDLELLGLQAPDAQAEALAALNEYWATCEIAAVGLVDMEVWHWMYGHPDATPAQLRLATLDIARGIWNRFYAPAFHQRDVVLLGVYSHMIDSFLYLPDYALGHMIAFQLAEHVKATPLGPEFERVARQGRILPDEWMKGATGKPVGPEALLAATEAALKAVKK